MKKQLKLTPELLVSGIAIILAVFAIILIVENKPVMSGYREVNCEKVQHSNGKVDCIVKLNSQYEEVKAYVGAH